MSDKNRSSGDGIIIAIIIAIIVACVIVTIIVFGGAFIGGFSALKNYFKSLKHNVIDDNFGQKALA